MGNQKIIFLAFAFNALAAALSGCGGGEFKSKLVFTVPSDPNAGDSSPKATPLKVGSECASLGGAEWKNFDASSLAKNTDGTINAPHILCSPFQIASFADRLNSEPDQATFLAIRSTHFIVNADLDFSLIYVAGEPEFTIGTAGRVYSGELNGNGYSFLNFKLTRPTQDSVGLFYSLGNSSKISYLTLSGFDVEGANFVGALAGTSTASVSKLSVLDSTISGRTKVGGFFGTANGEILSSSINRVAVKGLMLVGGMVGQTYSIIIKESEVFGTEVTPLFSGNALSDFGGIIGQMNSSQILDSRTAGNTIIGSDKILVQNVGGLAGRTLNGTNTFPKIQNSYSANLQILGSSNVGGLVGSADSATTILSSFSANDSNSTQYGYIAGGGTLIASPTTASNLFYSDASSCGANICQPALNLEEIAKPLEHFFDPNNLPFQATAEYGGWSNSVWAFHLNTALPTLISIAGQE